MFYTPSSSRLIVSPARRMLWWVGAALLVLCCAAVVVAFRPSAPDPRLAFPRIQGAGGVLPVDPSAQLPSATATHKLLIDVDSDASSRRGVNARLNTAAKILNLYALAGVPADKVHMVILFYGEGVNLALSDAAYREKYHRGNPNAELLSQLRRADVKMVACGQALGHQSFTLADVHPGVKLALSALTAREELQAAGYGSVPQENP
jgi:intracellular sulfur oxidation DsrE/DsrF family protein